ncbi:predicted protein [Sparassis crispa]|uniref:Pentatricopeptide repeat-containing protein n=1 Tax=Sparassis crispa TaxID=139825 RepID=A0A401G6E3_9APHY|nr:predicted protein [Sparassis crispa]GBE77735.1 predicted protein [Sparassis crispa]
METFRSFVDQNDVNGVHTSYRALKEYLPDTPTHRTAEMVSIDRQVVVGALTVLVTSGSPADRALAEEILADSTRLGIEAYLLYDAIFQSFLGRGALQDAFTWLNHMHLNPGRCKPQGIHYFSLLRACGTHKNFRFALSIVESKQPPTYATYRTLCKALSRSGYTLSVVELRDLVTSMKSYGVSFDPYLLRFIVDGYSNAGRFDLAEEAETLYFSAFDVHSDLRSADFNKDRRLSVSAKKNGKWSALSLYNKFREEGFCATQSTLQGVLHRTTAIPVLRFWERAFSMQAGPYVWAKIIRNAIEVNRLSTGLDLYQSAISSGIHPTNSMLHPILRALCASGLRPPSDAAVDRACDLYHEYVRLNDTPQTRSESNEAENGSSVNSTQPDAPIYNTLLRALCSSSNTEKYFPIALSLLEDMRSRKLSMDDMTLTSVTVLLMRSSSSFTEALKAYRLVCQSQDRLSPLQMEGYSAILNAYCKLSDRFKKVPPARLYFEIVQDMRLAGHDITPHVYTILLQQLAKLARLDPSLRDQVASSVRRVHDFLNVEASLKPDTALWNQLMDSYQRAGCFLEAYRIWESLYRSHEFDATSISVILDACGYAGQYDTALQIYSDLVDSGFQFDLRNWKNWLECLCRLDKVDEALKVLCLEMGEGAGNVEPDEESVRIVLKFATHTNFEGEARDRVKRYLPHLWKQMSQERRVVF